MVELVVKLPEGAVELLKTKGVDWLGAEHILCAVANGTPLPKGHGDLIDRKNVIDVIDWYKLNPQHFLIDNVIDDIKCMEFLVEADKEGAEE